MKSLKTILYITLALLFTLKVWALECIGPKDSKIVAVYLHGMDSEPPGSLELSNRSHLENISKSLQMGFAVPRAKDKCPDGKLFCWGWNFNDSKPIESAIATAMAAKAECFPNATSSGLIGFSNGGFVVNHIVKDCRQTPFKWFISVGAGSTYNQNDPTDLSQCGSIVLMAGKKDTYNYKPIIDFGNWLKSHGAYMSMVEYDNGHMLPEKDLETVLKFIF